MKKQSIRVDLPLLDEGHSQSEILKKAADAATKRKLSVCYSENESIAEENDSKEESEYDIYDDMSSRSGNEGQESVKKSQPDLEEQVMGCKSPQYEIIGESRERLLMRFLIQFMTTDHSG